VLSFVVLWLLGLAHRMFAVAALAAVFAFAGLHGVYGSMVPDSRTRTMQRTVAEAITDVEEAFGESFRCIGYDATLERRWHEFNYWYFLPGKRLERFHAADQQPCSELVIGPKEGLTLLVPRARRITFEREADAALWVYPGALSERLAEAGWLLPVDLGDPFPDTAYRSRITPATRLAGTKAGQPLQLVAQVQHAGAGSPWPSGHAVPGGASHVYVGVRLWSNGEVVQTAEAHLPQTLLPGQVAHIEVSLATTGLSEGDYVVELGLVHEDVDWFNDRGDETLRLPVRLA
jgi:hypothetical protein